MSFYTLYALDRLDAAHAIEDAKAEGLTRWRALWRRNQANLKAIKARRGGK